LGVKPLPEALQLARSLDLDLVEVAPMANPPVCRIMDYGKFRYEESQKAKESRKKTVHVSIKEVKFRPKIGKGDFDTKVRHMHDFLAEGHKVKVTLQFRGREMAHPELGSKILDAVLDQLGPGAKVETQARLEGRNMTMVLAPEKKAAPPKKSNERHDDGDPAADAAGAPDAERAAPAADTTEAPAPAPAASATAATATQTPDA
jgi:translation initiation factor IF-3